MEQINQEQFIETVKKYEFLYDIENRLYKDKNMRNETWIEIGKMFNLSSIEAKNNWTKLRNCYTNALKRRRIINGQAARKIGKWKFEDHMAFVKPYIETRFSTNLIADNGKIGKSEDQIDNELVIKDDQSEIGSLSSASSLSINETVNDKNTNNARVDDFVNLIKSNGSLLKDVLVNKNDINYAQDEHEMFYLSMARIIKNLPKTKQVEIRMDFCSMVCRAETEHFTSKLENPAQ